MDKYSQLVSKLADRRPVMMANLMVESSPLMMTALENADCVLLDKEHGVFGTEELIPMTLRCRSLGLPTIVRVEYPEYHLIAKSIDLGADGIMLPRAETVEQVRTAVEAIKFFPEGRTGCGGFGLLRDGEDLHAFNRNRVLIVQIESKKGLDNMEDMIAAYGKYINGFLIGPNDYSIMMECPFVHDSDIMLEQYRQFYAICKKYNKSCGVFDPDLSHIERDVSFGANIFWLSDDITYMKTGFEMFVKMANDALDAAKN